MAKPRRVILNAKRHSAPAQINVPRDFFTQVIDVDEGTWMNLDVSPNGQTITFDLLGDIYTMPIGGGEANCIRSGLAWEVQPRFSPDGKRIAFLNENGVSILDLETDAIHELVLREDHPYQDLGSDIAWSPDSQQLVFYSNREGNWDIFVTTITGSPVTNITNTPTRDEQTPTWRP